MLGALGDEHQNREGASLQLQDSLSLSDSGLGVSEGCGEHTIRCWQWAQGGEKWWKKQLAEAENRFNIVTLTMYLIDISFFFFVM